MYPTVADISAKLSKYNKLSEIDFCFNRMHTQKTQSNISAFSLAYSMHVIYRNLCSLSSNIRLLAVNEAKFRSHRGLLV